jgi:hypothetical protein
MEKLNKNKTKTKQRNKHTTFYMVSTPLEDIGMATATKTKVSTTNGTSSKEKGGERGQVLELERVRDLERLRRRLLEMVRDAQIVSLAEERLQTTTTTPTATQQLNNNNNNNSTTVPHPSQRKRTTDNTNKNKRKKNKNDRKEEEEEEEEEEREQLLEVLVEGDVADNGEGEEEEEELQREVRVSQESLFELNFKERTDAALVTRLHQSRALIEALYSSPNQDIVSSQNDNSLQTDYQE